MVKDASWPLDLLKTAVSISSLSGEEAAVADYLVSQLATFCDEAFVDAAGNAVGKLGRGDVHVIFLGHIDTVPGEIPVRLEQTRLYGRGTVDAKGSFCTAIAAAASLPPEVRERLTLTLIGAVEEEAPSSKGARYAVTAYPKPHYLIIGEPSGWDAMTLGYKGRLVVKLSLSKDNFHSAGDDSTAAEDMVEVWLKLRAWAEARNEGVTGIFDRVQLALQELESASDGLRQEARATVGLRLPPSLEPQAAEREIRALLEPLPLTLEFRSHELPYRGAKDTPLTRAFRVAIRAEGAPARQKVKTGTSDMNVVAPVWNVPVLAYGPGDSGLDHRPDEHLDLAEYARAIAVLARVLAGLSLP